MNYQLGSLWNGSAFRDQAWNQTLVPNKNATTLEALLLYEELSGCSMEPYVFGAAQLILSAQVIAPGPRQGATVHLGTGPHRLAIGIYTARCLAALVRLYRCYPREEYLNSAREMLAFLLRLIVADGTLFGIYPDGHPISCPTWISPSGDLLRALIAMRPFAPVPDQVIDQLGSLIVASQFPSGGIPTAFGLGQKGQTRRPSGRPDFRDLIPVVGWCDKSFRALTMLAFELELASNSSVLAETTVECTWKNRECLFHEDAECMALIDQRRRVALYEWKKGEDFPRVYLL